MLLDDLLMEIRAFAGRRHSIQDVSKIKSILLGAAGLLDDADLAQVVAEIKRVTAGEPTEPDGGPAMIEEVTIDSSGKPVRHMRPALGTARTISDAVRGRVHRHMALNPGVTLSEARRHVLAEDRVLAFADLHNSPGDPYDVADAAVALTERAPALVLRSPVAVRDEVRRRTREFADRTGLPLPAAQGRVLESDPALADAYHRAFPAGEPVRVHLGGHSDLPDDPLEVREQMRREVRAYASKHGVDLKTAFGAMRDLNPDLWRAYAHS